MSDPLEVERVRVAIYTREGCLRGLRYVGFAIALAAAVTYGWYWWSLNIGPLLLIVVTPLVPLLTALVVLHVIGRRVAARTREEVRRLERRRSDQATSGLPSGTRNDNHGASTTRRSTRARASSRRAS